MGDVHSMQCHMGTVATNANVKLHEAMELRSKLVYHFKPSVRKKPYVKLGNILMHQLPRSLLMERMKTSTKVRSKFVFPYSPSLRIKMKYGRKVTYKGIKVEWNAPRSSETSTREGDSSTREGDS